MSDAVAGITKLDKVIGVKKAVWSTAQFKRVFQVGQRGVDESQ
ncbi:unnamed protein product [marine sediment metagenome]|uniref:Uncharacterized protein n=1 Tax=marine sediment metagenome TaxID=412755 RepID=X1BRH0_9ZZZZ